MPNIFGITQLFKMVQDVPSRQRMLRKYMKLAVGKEEWTDEDANELFQLIDIVPPEDFLFNQRPERLFQAFQRNSEISTTTKLAYLTIFKFRTQFDLPIEKLVAFIVSSSQASKGTPELFKISIQWLEELIIALEPRKTFELVLKDVFLFSQLCEKYPQLQSTVKSLFKKSLFLPSLIPQYESVVLQMERLEPPSKKQKRMNGAKTSLAFPSLFFEKIDSSEKHKAIHICFDAFLEASKAYYEGKYVRQSSDNYVSLKQVQKQRRAEQRRNDVEFYFYQRLMSADSTKAVETLLKHRVYQPRLDKSEQKKSFLTQHSAELLRNESWEELGGLIAVEPGILDGKLDALFDANPSSSFVHTIFELYASQRRAPSLIEAFLKGSYPTLSSSIATELALFAADLPHSQLTSMWSLCLETLPKSEDILKALLGEIIVTSSEVDDIWTLAKATRKLKKEGLSISLLAACHQIFAECAPYVSSDYEQILMKDVKFVFKQSCPKAPFLFFFLHYFASKKSENQQHLEKAADELWAEEKSWENASVVVSHCTKSRLKKVIKWARKQDLKDASIDLLQSHRFQVALCSSICKHPDSEVILQIPEGLLRGSKLVKALQSALNEGNASLALKLVSNDPSLLRSVDCTFTHKDATRIFGICLARSGIEESWLVENLKKWENEPAILAALCGRSGLRKNLKPKIEACIQKMENHDDIWQLVKACQMYGYKIEISSEFQSKLKSKKRELNGLDSLLIDPKMVKKPKKLLKELLKLEFSGEVRVSIAQLLKVHADVRSVLLDMLEAGENTIMLLQFYHDSPVCFTPVYYKLLCIVLKLCREADTTNPSETTAHLFATLSHILATRNFNVTSAEVASCLGTCLEKWPKDCLEKVANIVSSSLKHRSKQVVFSFPLLQPILYKLLDECFLNPTLSSSVCRVLCLLAQSNLHRKVKPLYLSVVEYFFMIAGEQSIPELLKEELFPGIFAIFDVCKEKNIVDLAQRMSDSEKLIFKEVRDTYKKRFRYTGQ